MSYSVDNENRRAESAHKTREEYKKKEAELKKKQNQEVNKLNKQHAEVVRNVQKEHDDQLTAIRNKNQETLTEQDKKYQKEIDKIRETHKNQSKNAAMENEELFQQLQDQRVAELEKQKKIYETKEKSLATNYDNDRVEREQNFNNIVNEMRKKQIEGLESEKTQLETKHRRDSSELRKHQDTKVSDLTLELQNTRDSKNAEISSLREKLITDRLKVEDDKLSAIQQERKNHSVHVNKMADDYSENLEGLRHKYEQANLNANYGRGAELENMKNNADRRLNEQVSKRERQLINQRNENDLQMFLLRQQASDEKKNYMNQAKVALDTAEMQRNQIYDSVNKKTATEIKTMAKKNDENIATQSKYYQGRLNEAESKYNESIENQVNYLEQENDQDRKNFKIKNQKTAYMLTKEKNDLESYYQEMLQEKDRVNKSDLEEQRFKLINERNEVVKHLESRLRETENKNTERQNLLVQKYEKEIQDLKDLHKAENKRQAYKYERQIETMTKDHKMQLENERIAGEAREKQLKEQFGRQTASMENRHQEEKIKMAIKTK